jgi:hypothetical protein
MAPRPVPNAQHDTDKNMAKCVAILVDPTLTFNIDTQMHHSLTISH